MTKPKQQGDDKKSGQEDELKAKLEEAEGRALRAVAELQNAKRRMEEDKRSFAAFANQGLILELLGIVESFNRSAEHLPEDLKSNEWAKGVLMIDQQLNAFLAKQGVKKIEVKKGDAIDPSKHEVVMREGEGQLVVDVLERGYEMNGRVVKPARVKVG
ncbi:MAG: nucleotide exchange factor GrpE [bacterium]|nr:nucleotide exchange factor GrpE [bacterium]